MNRTGKVLVGVFLIISIIFIGKGCAKRGRYEGNISSPVQVNLKNAEIIMHEGKEGAVKIKPRAEYEITGIVKLKVEYDDFGSQVSKYDLGLAWGKVNNKKIDKYMKYRKANRGLHYIYSSKLPVGIAYVEEHICNLHAIHKDDKVLRRLDRIEKGDIVTLKGFLVDVDFSGATWSTSLIRTDTGYGGCEVMYIEEIQFRDRKGGCR